MNRAQFVGKNLLMLTTWTWLALVPQIPTAAQTATNEAQLEAELPASIWSGRVGMGLRPGTTLFSVQPALTVGMKTLGSLERHDLAMINVAYGRTVFDVVGRDKWYRGNLELRGEFFAGSQFSPEGEWIVGIGPHLRYYFMTGTPLIPFVHGGAGILATSIGPPDLSGYFEFHEQLGVGFHYFLRPDLSITCEARFLHISCAGINKPNRGLNGVTALLGATWLW